MGWRVTVGDLSLAEEELTVAQAVDICDLAAGGWDVLDPLHSPRACAAIVAVLLASSGTPLVDAVAAVNVMPVVELLAAVSEG